jgi:hypothetical protein
MIVAPIKSHVSPRRPGTVSRQFRHSLMCRWPKRYLLWRCLQHHLQRIRGAWQVQVARDCARFRDENCRLVATTAAFTLPVDDCGQRHHRPGGRRGDAVLPGAAREGSNRGDGEFVAGREDPSGSRSWITCTRDGPSKPKAKQLRAVQLKNPRVA